MKLLDCENYDTSISSIEKIYEIEESDIFAFMKGVKLKALFKSISFYKFIDKIYLEFSAKFKIVDSEILAYWFHTTRSTPTTTFEEGLLPLKEAIPKAEELISVIVDKLKIKQCKKKADNCDKIKHKLSTVSDPGPWGLLIRELALSPKNEIHDYLKTPELIEDIISCKYPENKVELLGAYSELTIPVIIKLQCNSKFHPDLLAYVINYLFYKINKLDLSNCDNMNRSCRGIRVNPNNIEKIEYL